MRNFRSFESRKRGLSPASPSSFARPVRPFVPVPAPSLQPVLSERKAQFEHARRFGHSLDRISLLPPEHHPPARSEEGQQKRSVQDDPQASMESIPPESAQTEKRPRLGWNFADIPLFPDPTTLPSATIGSPASLGQRLPTSRVLPRLDVHPVPPPAVHPFAIQMMQRRERDETREQNMLPKKNATGLPDILKAGIETLSGLSLDDVHVHYNSSQPAEVQARAYTQGTDIHVGPGQERHLAHEAWHVVQQIQGRVRPTRQFAGMELNDERGLEREADVMGIRAVQVNPGQAIRVQENQHANSGGPVQMVDEDFQESLRQLALAIGIGAVTAGGIEAVLTAYFGVPSSFLRGLFVALGTAFVGYVASRYKANEPIKQTVTPTEAKKVIKQNEQVQQTGGIDQKATRPEKPKIPQGEPSVKVSKQEEESLVKPSVKVSKQEEILQGASSAKASKQEEGVSQASRSNLVEQSYEYWQDKPIPAFLKYYRKDVLPEVKKALENVWRSRFRDENAALQQEKTLKVGGKKFVESSEQLTSNTEIIDSYQKAIEDLNIVIRSINATNEQIIEAEKKKGEYYTRLAHDVVEAVYAEPSRNLAPNAPERQLVIDYNQKLTNIRGLYNAAIVAGRNAPKGIGSFTLKGVQFDVHTEDNNYISAHGFKPQDYPAQSLTPEQFQNITKALLSNDDKLWQGYSEGRLAIFLAATIAEPSRYAPATLTNLYAAANAQTYEGEGLKAIFQKLPMTTGGTDPAPGAGNTLLSNTVTPITEKSAMRERDLIFGSDPQWLETPDYLANLNKTRAVIIQELADLVRISIQEFLAKAY